MRRLVGFFCLITLITSTADAQDSTLDEIRRAEEQLAAALVSKDAATFDRLVAPSFVLRGNPDMTRATWIQNALTMCWGAEYEISQLGILHVAGDTTIVSLLLTTRQDPVTCEPAVIRSLLTDVWVRSEGRQYLYLRHSGPAASNLASQFTRTAPPPPRWEGTTELSLVATGGNTDTQTLGAGGTFVWRPGMWVSRGRAAFVRSVTADTTTAESVVAELRQSRRISPKAEAFGRADYLINRFAGIDYRLALDAGIGWTVRETARTTIKIDGGAGVVHEARLRGDDQTYGVGTAALQYRWQFSRHARLDERGVLSSGLAEPENWQLQNTLGLTVDMTRRLSVKVSHDLKRVSRPTPGFKKTDTILSAALVARF